MLKEFKEFAIKGNVVDMAVGIMIGAAFTTVVKSVVDDLVMPLISLLTGGLNFVDQFVVLRAGKTAAAYATLAKARADAATVLAYGQFVTNVISFVLVALVLFFMVRWINRLRRSDTPPAPNTKACEYCKLSIDIAATRCAHCTSQVLPAPADESAPADQPAPQPA